MKVDWREKICCLNFKWPFFIEQRGHSTGDGQGHRPLFPSSVPFVRLRCIARVMLFPSPAAAAAAAVDLWPR